MSVWGQFALVVAGGLIGVVTQALVGWLAIRTEMARLQHEEAREERQRMYAQEDDALSFERQALLDLEQVILDARAKWMSWNLNRSSDFIYDGGAVRERVRTLAARVDDSALHDLVSRGAQPELSDELRDRVGYLLRTPPAKRP